jgi:YHS domain-containing protein
MVRAIVYIVAALLLISVIRAIIGVLSKGAAELFQGTPAPTARPPSSPSVGELKKDPVCGTFVAAATAFQKSVGAETFYFCSATCRDKFKT